jgi:hypothetical protein
MTEEATSNGIKKNIKYNYTKRKNTKIKGKIDIWFRIMP